MATTPKSSRSAPQRRFENYVLQKTSSPRHGLTEIVDSSMTTIITGNDVGGLSGFRQIGFDFSFDGVTYKRLLACSSGWLALVAPAETDQNDVQNRLITSTSGSQRNEGIALSNPSDNVLLCPWFDDLRTTSTDPSLWSTSFGTEKIRRIREGLQPPQIVHNEVEFGVKMFNDVRSNLGRRCIVRWSCVSSPAYDSTNLRFDAVLYENGTIEFRYPPRNSLSLVDIVTGGATTDDATVGIFMPGTNRFRDFSPGLGYNDNARPVYRYGGAIYDASFLDTGYETNDTITLSRPYTWRLRPAVHWPGLDRVGTTLSFVPPQNRRRVLPRLQHRRNDNVTSRPPVERLSSDRRSGHLTSQFDDRFSIPFGGNSATGSVTSGPVVSYPTTLPLLHGNSDASVLSKLDVFSPVGDMEFTGSILKNAIEPYLSRHVETSLAPWSENKIYENDPSNVNDEFFSGSRAEDLGMAMSSKLRSKTHIKFSLPVNYTTTMFGVSSSIYYYNANFKSWMVPQNSTTAISNGSTSMPASSKGDIAYAGNDSPNQRIIEDARGFGALGNVVSSGSRTPSAAGDQTDSSLGATYTVENATLAMGKPYAKSIFNNEEYRATSNEILRLPLQRPFVIEKAIIEVPLAMGDGWFRDLTTAMQPLESSTGSFDVGGPGITVALFNQHVVGSSTRRDLIMSGTITHFDDNTNQFTISNFAPLDSTYQIRQLGFKSFGAKPAAVVTPVTASGNQLQFTGSVPVRMTAMTSNGLLARFTRLMDSATTSTNRSGTLDLFNTQYLVLEDRASTNFLQRVNIAQVNGLGRANTGFSPSGRSVFGKELTTSTSITAQGKVRNPFYVSGGLGGISFNNIRSVLAPLGKSQVADAVISGSNFTCQAALLLEGHRPSPYLVYPNDTLILSISKTRPVFYGTLASTPFTSGSIAHDVKLLTGSINVTLYGAMLREGTEVHDSLNQPLMTDAVTETLCNDSVIDQFDVSYVEQLSGSYTDQYVTGSLVRLVQAANGRLSLVTGSRSVVASRVDARSSGYPTTDSVAYNSQPWHERLSAQRFVEAVDYDERYWDSMMPDFADCMEADGCGLWLNKSDPTAFGDVRRVDKKTCAYMMFDGSDTFLIGGNANIQALFNLNWTKAYPFEPRYLGVARQRNATSRFAVTRHGPSGDSVPTTERNGLIFGPVSLSGEVNSLGVAISGDYKWTLFSDIYLNKLTGSFVLTSSCSPDDSARGLYGFGDLNTCFLATTGSQRNGTNHFVDFRNGNTSGPTNDEISLFVQSPVIRGWKYGVASGLPLYTKAVFRRDSYGQFRDMLEQRAYTKFGLASGAGSTNACVNVKFVDSEGRLTEPANTWSQNLSFESTSSMPFCDGISTSRPEINSRALNSTILSLTQEPFNLITM